MSSNQANLYADIEGPNLRLMRLLDGVASAPNPTMRLLENAVEGIAPDDILGEWQMAGFLLDHRDEITCALIGRRRQ
jgi:hypothetical protein